MPRALGWFHGEGQFVMSEVPLYHDTGIMIHYDTGRDMENRNHPRCPTTTVGGQAGFDELSNSSDHWSSCLGEVLARHPCP